MLLLQVLAPWNRFNYLVDRKYEEDFLTLKSLLFLSNKIKMMIDLIDSISDSKKTERIDEQYNYCQKISIDGQIADVDANWCNVWSAFITNGLCFSEKVVCKGNVPYLWREHYYNITEALSKLQLSAYDMLQSKDLLRRIEVLCQKNHYPPYSVVRIIIWLQNEDNKLHYCIIQQRLSKIPYIVNTEKILLTTYEYPLTITPFSWIDQPNAFYTIAHNDAKNRNYNGACIINGNNEIITTTLGNLYLIVSQYIIGVQYDNGARRDPIEEYIAKAAEQLGYKFKFLHGGVNMKMLSEAHDCFVGGTTFGIKPILGFDTTIRYRRENSLKLAAKFYDLFVY